MTHKMSPKISFLSQFWPIHNTSIKTVAYPMHHLACYQWSEFQLKLTTLGYSRKIQTGGLRVYFLKIPLEFLDLSLCPRKFQRKQAFPLDIPWFFSYTPGNSTPLLIDPWNFHMFFLQYPWKFHVLNPRYCFDFFWNSPFWGVLAKT